MTDRGVLYIAWGNVGDMLTRSIASLAAHHPELPVHVQELPQGATLLEKARMLDFAPFAETLYLDVDTVVLDRLDFGFEKAKAHGLAVSICECPWARRYAGLAGDIVEYNTGVVFFTAKARPVFESWKAHAGALDSSMVFLAGGEYRRMPVNDQAAFAKSVEETGYAPFVLPYNWNFRPKWHFSWFGPIKVWHDYEPVPEPILARNREQRDAAAVISMAALRP
jgi:hypothetical protein